MKDLHSLKETYSFSPEVERVWQGLLPREHSNRAAEGTWTNDNIDGKTPFLDAFEKYDGEPYEICLAHGIVNSWLETEPIIYDGDIIVGVTRPRRVVYEHFSHGLCCSIDDKHLMNRPEYRDKKDEIKERLNRFWRKMEPLNGSDHMYPRCASIFGKEAADQIGRLMWFGGYQGHTVPSYPMLLSLGIDGAKEKIAERMVHFADDERKITLYRAMNILLDGFTAFAEQYAAKAEEKAATAPDADKGNYLRVASICRTIAHKAPETLGEAVQLTWFYSLWDWVDCIGRTDQYLYPFYKKCVEDEGRTVAENYICSLWFRIFENGVHNITLGGVKPDGSDATNELTYLFLQIGRKCHKTHPRITVRFHKNSPKDLMELVVKMWAEGMSDPSVTSDETAVNGLMEYGVPVEDARDYSMLGCQEIEIPGKSNFGCEDGAINLAKIFEYTVNNGCDRFSGARFGLPTGYLTDYTSIEQLWDAFASQIVDLVPKWVELTNLGVDIRVANRSKIVKSIFTEACIERGLDLDDGGAIYNYGVVETCGSSAVADCFAAIQKLVFEEKKISMETLRAAIDADFEGYEKERQMLLHAPKFGNDDDYVDWWCKRILDFFWTEIGKYRSRRGDVFTGACSLLESGIGYGNDTWALPDGRHKGEPLSNTIGPREGNDRCGTTAMLSSVAKLPLKKGVGGTTLNVMLPRSLMQTDELRTDISNMMFVYLMKGGQMAQITTADIEDMRDAQVNPDKHRDLIVRVGGFSIEFVQLGRESQNEIISRYAE